MSTIEEARFFSRLFTLSFGNIGHAIKLWIASIEKVEDQKISLRKLRRPDLEFLNHLPEEWVIILNRFILQKYCTLEDFKTYDGTYKYSEHNIELKFIPFSEAISTGPLKECSGEVEFRVGVDI